MGKPLIGDTQMLAIHSTMLRLRELAPPVPQPGRARITANRPIALLAATLLQLRPCDILFLDEADSVAAEVLSLAQESTFAPQHVSVVNAGASAATVAAGHALAQSRSTRPADDAPVTVALLRDDTVLDDVIALAGEHLLPLLLIVQSGSVARSTPLESIPNVEVVRIDADDAVACCRVMQESLLRTRNRWGSVVLQAVSLPGATDPVLAFEAHLRRRNLSPAL